MLKTVSSVINALGALNYVGTWNASTNIPNLSALSAQKGDYYVVSVAGSTTLGGISTWYVGDWAVYNGAVWQRVEGGDDDPAPSVRSNSSTGVLQVTGPAAASTRVMTVPDANFTAARTDAAQTFTGLQTLNSGAEIGSTSLAGKIAKVRKNYYQVSDNRTITSGTVNFLSIDFGASTKIAAIINICSTAFSPGVSDFSRAETLFVTRDASGVFTITSKASQGDVVTYTVTSSVSGNSVLLTYTYNATVGAQYNNAYVEIIGINATTAESTFTVTVL